MPDYQVKEAKKTALFKIFLSFCSLYVHDESAFETLPYTFTYLWALAHDFCL